MKKRFYYIAVAVLTLGLASCAKVATTPEQPATPEVPGQMTIVANIGDDASTKTTLSGDDLSGYDILWREGDKIEFYFFNGSDCEFRTYTLTEGAGTKYGKFTGPAVPTSITYNAYAGYGDNLVTRPKSTLNVEDQHYSEGTNASFSPMMAKIAIENGNATLSDFKNIGGLLRLSLKGSGTVKEIKLTTDQNIAGFITIDEDGAAVMDNEILFNPNRNYTTLNCGEGVELSSTEKPFFISLPKGNYTGVKIEVTNNEGKKCYKVLKAGKTLSIKRSQITPVSLTCNEYISPITGVFPNSKGNLVRWFQLWEGGPKFAEYNVGGSPTDIKAELYQFNNIPSWGSNWRLPTRDEMENGLIKKCDFKDTTVDGVKGKLFTGRGMYSFNSIFLPMAGLNYPAFTFYPNQGDYWCSDPNDTDGCARFKISENTRAGGSIADLPGADRYECSVRYVLK